MIYITLQYIILIYIILITYITFKLWKYMIMCIVMQLDAKHKFYCFVCILWTNPVGDFIDVFSVIAFWVLIIPCGWLPCKNFHLWNYVGVQKFWRILYFEFLIRNGQPVLKLYALMPKRRLCRGFWAKISFCQ